MASLLNQVGCPLFIILIITFVVSSIITEIQVQGKEAAQKSQTRAVFKSPCGTEKQVAAKAGQCLEPLYETLRGDSQLPGNDEGLLESCQRFNMTERCIRGLARDCLQGVHKTAMSSVASATRRFRVAECKNAAVRAKYIDPLLCLNKYNKEMQELLRNHTAIAQGIRDLKKSPEERLIAACCLLEAMDRHYVLKFDKLCPESVPLVLGMMHSITDDARNTLCLRPKCNGVLNNVIKSSYQPPQSIIEPFFEIVFAI